jgi:dTDP-4-amino-4,6-dideoxygalactose transaminase
MQADEVRIVARAAAGLATGSSARQPFERAFAEYLGVKHVFALDSARAALCLILRALDLPRGSRIVLPAYCFFTLPLVVESLDLVPVFAPVDIETHALDPSRLDPHLEGASALVLVHPFGQIAHVEAVLERCEKASVPLIEDPSQSTGASRAGRKAGSFGLASTFSLVQGKNLQTLGGGLLATRDARLAGRVRGMLASARPPDGSVVRSRMRSGLLAWATTTRPGFTLGAYPAFRILDALDRDRLDALFREARTPFEPDAGPVLLSEAQSELGLLGLERLDPRNDVRRLMAEILLDGLAGEPLIGLPGHDESAVNTWNAVAVRVPDAPGLARALLRRGIDTRMDYMEWFGQIPDDPPGILYLPNHPGLSPEDMERVVREVRSILA